MTTLATDTRAAMLELLLSIADDKLMLGHRNSDWTGLGPILEEDIAFSSLAQDEIAHAQALYELASSFDEQRRSADALAFGRTAQQYRCAQIVELPDEFNWATALARQLYCDHFDRLRLARLSASGFTPLAQLAKRLQAEEQIHVEHSDGWVIRLGRGDAESNKRMQKAIDSLAPQAVMLFEPVQQMDVLVREGLYSAGGSEMFNQWRDEIVRVCTEASLRVQLDQPDPTHRGGRHGVHLPVLTELLDEMCAVYRLAPGARW
jgi:ring-1,2-phenylacetyl-CoA epoxidase subunit PaaC